MDGSFSSRRFRAAVTAISPREVPLRSWKRNEIIIRVCTERSSIHAGTRSLRTPMLTCRFRAAENSFPHRCITSCGSPARMECMPDTYQVIRHRMAVSGCRSSTRSRSLTRSVSVLRSRCTEGRQQGVILGNPTRDSRRRRSDFEIRASILDFDPLRLRGGGDKGILHWNQPPTRAATKERRKRSAGMFDVTVAVRVPSYRHYLHWPSSVHARGQPSQPGC